MNSCAHSQKAVRSCEPLKAVTCRSITRKPAPFSGRPQAIYPVRLVDEETPNRLLDVRVRALGIYPCLLADQGVEFFYSKWEDHSQNAFKATPPSFCFRAHGARIPGASQALGLGLQESGCGLRVWILAGFTSGATIHSLYTYAQDGSALSISHRMSLSITSPDATPHRPKRTQTSTSKASFVFLKAEASWYQALWYQPSWTDLGLLAFGLMQDCLGRSVILWGFIIQSLLVRKRWARGALHEDHHATCFDLTSRFCFDLSSSHSTTPFNKGPTHRLL